MKNLAIGNLLKLFQQRVHGPLRICELHILLMTTVKLIFCSSSTPKPPTALLKKYLSTFLPSPFAVSRFLASSLLTPFKAYAID